MKTNFKESMGPEEEQPDIFRAARNNDVAELLAALADGQSLSIRHDVILGQTPIHFAARRNSNDFLGVASNHPSFDPWLRDDNERTAFDYADAHCNELGKRILFERMYPTPDTPHQGYIDTDDCEPSEFFPGN